MIQTISAEMNENVVELLSRDKLKAAMEPSWVFFLL